MRARARPVLVLTFLVSMGLIQGLWALVPGTGRAPESPAEIGVTSSSGGEVSDPPVVRAAPRVGGTSVGVVSGRVFWPDGEPFSTGEAALWSPGDGVWPRGAPRCALDDGRFRLDAEPGATFDLVICADVHEHRSHDIHPVVRHISRVRAGQTGLEIRLAGALLDLAVEGPDGRPIRSGLAIVDAVGNFVGPRGREISVRDGRARGLLPGSVRRVVVSVYDAEDADARPLGRCIGGPYIVGGGSVRVRVPAGRNLRGRVVTPEGEGIEGVHVEVVHAPKLLNFGGGWKLPDSICRCGFPTSDAEGRFTVRGVAFEPVRLVVLVPDPWLRPRERMVGSGENDLTIVLRKGVYPEIRVLDPDGNPATGEVGVSHEDDPHPPFHLERSRRIREGVAAPGPLDPDVRYALFISPSHRSSRPLKAVSIDDWLPADTTVRLEWAEPDPAQPPAPEPEPGPDGVLRVRLNDPGGKGADRADALLVPEDGGPSRSVSLWLRRDPCLIRRVDPAKSYTLLVVGIGSGDVVRATGLRVGSGVVELVPRPGEAIRGQVRLPEGTTSVWLTPRRGDLRMSTTGDAIVLPDGSFEIPGLLPGAWDVEIHVRVGETKYGNTVRLTTGAPPELVTVSRVE